MQKVELRNQLLVIAENLKSKVICDLFQSKSGGVHKDDLVSIIVESKAGYDSLLSAKQTADIANTMELQNYYNTVNQTRLISAIYSFGPSHNSIGQYLSNIELNGFYGIHTALLNTIKIVDTFLISDKDYLQEGEKLDLINAAEKGYLIIDIASEGQIQLKVITEIMLALQNLILQVSEYFEYVEKQKIEMVPNIAMIDSGSDINITIKLPKKATLIISTILKEFWEAIISFKTYKFKKRNEAMIDAITTLKAIKGAENEIGRERTELLISGILDSTEKIVFNHALPKSIFLENKEFSTRRTLIEKSKTLLLEEGKKEETN